MITQRLIDWANNYLLRRAQARLPRIADPVDDIDETPSQTNKPSPKSSLTTNQLFNKLSIAFPEDLGYEIRGIANTNSMEPMLDDSDLVVLEQLTGDWREERLIKQPFAAGQVVIYPSTQGRIIHMLKTKTTWLGKPAWVIQGVNNFLPDMAKIPESLLIARLVGISYGRQVREGD